MSQQTWTIILVAIGITIIIYGFWGRQSLIKSLVKDDIQTKGAHQLYYLPTALLQIKVSARVIMIKDATTGNITGSGLSELSLETKVEIVPDTRFAFGLKYLSSALANDEVSISISSNGLIEGLNLTAEDRLSQIIEQITQSPKIILSTQDQESRAKAKISEDQPVITETKEFTTNFTILTKELRDKKAKRIWTINIDGPAAKQMTEIISLNFEFETDDAQFGIDKSKSVDGIIIRPLSTMFIAVTLDTPQDPDNIGTRAPGLEYQVLVPNESAAIAVPIDRSAFVKKTYTLKSPNGLLTESTVTKPSELEGFLSIPINIAKAIVSIPAQLLSFKIEKVKRQTAFNTELIKTKLEAEKILAEAEKNVLVAKTDLDKARIDSENTLAEMRKLHLETKELLSNKFKQTQ